MDKLVILSVILMTLSFSVWGIETGLVSYWSFDEEGQKVNDFGPAEINGFIEGNVQRVPGLTGQALSFPGALDSYVVFENKAPLDLQEAFTLSAWVYRDNTGTRWDGILINGHSQKGYQLFYSEMTQHLTLYIHTDETPYHPVAGAHIPMYEWMHLAVTYDGEQVQIFQNARRTANQKCRGKVTDFPDKFYLGSAVNPFSAFRGLLDEVRIYNRALTEEEIMRLYVETAPKDHTPSPEPEPAFEKLEAIRTPEGIRFTFQATEDSVAKESKGTTLSIYRNSHPRNDHNPGVKNGDLIFSGELQPDSEGIYTFLDTHPVSVGYTYYYWVSPDQKNFRIFPAKVRIHRPDIWWTPEVIREKTREIAELYPELVEIRTIGETAEGRSLEALLVGNQDRMISFVGAVHVSESGPELILGALKKLLDENPHLVQEVGIAAVPCVTLDERDRLLSTGYSMYLRKNARGVDLNRNFPAYWEELPPPGTMQTNDPNAEIYRGPEPASEPETQALMAFIQMVNPWVSFYFHSLNSLCNAGFVSSKYALLEEDTEYMELSEQVARIYAHAMYGDDYEQYYWLHHNSSQGSHDSYTYLNLRTPSLTLELDKREEGQVVYHDGVTPELLEEYQVRHQKAMEAIIQGIMDGTIQRLERKSMSTE